MEVLAHWLPISGAVLVLVIGCIGFFKTNLIIDGIGIQATKPEGISELRAVIGGANIGGPLAGLVLQSSAVFTALGCVWLGILAARFYSIVVDEGSTFKNSAIPIALDGTLAFLFLSTRIFA